MINMTELLKEYKSEYNFIDNSWYVSELDIDGTDEAFVQYEEDIKNDNFKSFVRTFETLIGTRITEEIEKIAFQFAINNLDIRERILA